MRRHPCSDPVPAHPAPPRRGLERGLARAWLVAVSLAGTLVLSGPARAMGMGGEEGIGWVVPALRTSSASPGSDAAPARAPTQDAEPAQSADATPEDDPDAPTPAEGLRQVVVRAISFGALVVLIGAIVFARVIIPAMMSVCSPVLRERLRAGVRSVGTAAAALVAVAAVLRALAQHSMLVEAMGGDIPVPYADVLSGTFGLGVLLQLVGGSAGLLAFPRRDVPGRGNVFALLALLAAVAPALGGHAAGEDSLLLPVAADTLHVLAAGSWAGALAVLAFVALPATLREAPEACGVAVLTMLRRFTRVALGSAAALLLTGLYASWIHLGSLAALWSTRYGNSLLLKLLLLAAMALIGAVNWRRLGPASGTVPGARRLARSAWTELAFALAIVVVTAVLVARPTPSEFLP